MFFKFDKIRERDVDFALMRAFSLIPEFTDFFLSKAGWNGAEILCIEHSFTDETGESDITLSVLYNGETYAVLIENKIDAPAMHSQAERYQKKGKKWKTTGKYKDFIVFLVAPQNYIDSNSEAKKYKNQIAYEDILGFFNTPSHSFDYALLKKAIEKQATGYSVQEVPEITEFWRKLHDYFCAETKIKMYYDNHARRSRSLWPQFKIPLKGASLFYKSDQGVVDLEFNIAKIDESWLNNELKPYIDADIHCVKTGKALCLRINEVPKMNFRNPFEHYRTEEKEKICSAIQKLSEIAVRLNDHFLLS